MADANTEEIHISNRKTSSHKTVNLEKLLKSPKRDTLVQDGDTIFIARKEPFISSDVVVTVTLVATLLTIISTAAILANSGNNNQIKPLTLTFP